MILVRLIPSQPLNLLLVTKCSRSLDTVLWGEWKNWPAQELRVRSVNSLGFTAVMQKNKRVGPACFVATKRIWKDTDRCRRIRCFVFRHRTPQGKKSGGLGVNKRNRWFPADFEFIERPLIDEQTMPDGNLFCFCFRVMFFHDIVCLSDSPDSYLEVTKNLSC